MAVHPSPDLDLSKEIEGKPMSDDNNCIRSHENTYFSPSDINENDYYVISFHFNQAIAASVIHFSHFFFGPLSLPILYKKYGKPLLTNMRFAMTPYYLYELIAWLWIIFTVVSFKLLEEIAYQLIPLYLAAGFIIFLRTFFVSIKYGYIASCLWEELNTNILPESELGRITLITAWLKFDLTVAQRELALAYKRLNPPYKNLHLSFKREPCQGCQDRFSEYFEEHGGKFDKQNFEFLYYAQLIIEEIQRQPPERYFFVSVIMPLCYSISPIALRFYRYGSSWLKMSPFEIFFISFSIITAFYFSRKYLLYIQAGIEDFKRKKSLMGQCSGIVSLIDSTRVIVCRDCAPRLDISDHYTIISWYYMRRCFLDFGKRFTIRIFLYTSVVLPMSIGVIIILILQLLNVIGAGYNYYFVPFMILIVQTLYMIIIMALVAVDLNGYFDIHIDILLDQIGKILRKRITEPERFKEPEVLIDAIDFVTAKLEEDKVLRPIKVMGISMDTLFILKILSIIASGAFAVIQIYIKS